MGLSAAPASPPGGLKLSDRERYLLPHHEGRQPADNPAFTIRRGSGETGPRPSPLFPCAERAGRVAVREVRVELAHHGVRLDIVIGTRRTVEGRLERTITRAAALGCAFRVSIEAAQSERKTGPLMRDFADEFIRRCAHRWKPSTRKSNLHLLRRTILPCLGGMRVAEVNRADVQRWFDSLSGTPGVANRALPVLSVMMTAAEL